MGGLLAGAHARDERTGFLQVVRRLPGIEHDGRVEETEEDDGGTVQQGIYQLPRLQYVGDFLQPARVLVLAEPVGHRGREQDDAGSENRRYDARHVQFQGQMRGLPGVHLPAHLPLGVIDGDAALAPFHEDYETGHDDGDG